MKYIDSVKGSFISLFLLTPLVIFVKGTGSIPIVEMILTISSFLFAIFAGFFISRLNSRYSEIREYISEEDAYFLSLFQISQVYGKKFVDKITNLIEEYYITAFENKIEDYYKQTAKPIQKIYDELYKMKEKSGESIYANMFSILLSLELVRNKNSVVGKEKIAVSQWLVMIGLSIIIFMCLMYLNTNEPLFQFLIIFLGAVLVLILLTLRDLQNLRLGGKIMPVLESGEEVLESIGKPRYYNTDLLKESNIKIPKDIKKYRLASHKPDGQTKIKIINK
ncbi:MAG: hypothetical protein WC070_04185 [Candidatus Magasanikbacteria bacterium]